MQTVRSGLSETESTVWGLRPDPTTAAQVALMQYLQIKTTGQPNLRESTTLSKHTPQNSVDSLFLQPGTCRRYPAQVPTWNQHAPGCILAAINPNGRFQ